MNDCKIFRSCFLLLVMAFALGIRAEEFHYSFNREDFTINTERSFTTIESDLSLSRVYDLSLPDLPMKIETITLPQGYDAVLESWEIDTVGIEGTHKFL